MGLLNPFAGFLVGPLVAFTGVGGGALMTPMLILIFGVAPSTAVGTDLMFASITKGEGGWVHGTRDSIDWIVLGRLSLWSLPAAVITQLLNTHIPSDQGMTALMLQSLGFVLALTGLAMLFKSRLHGLGQRQRTGTPERFKRAQPARSVR